MFERLPLWICSLSAQPAIDVRVTNTWDWPTLTTLIVGSVAALTAALAAYFARRSALAAATAAQAAVRSTNAAVAEHRLKLKLEFMSTYGSEAMFQALEAVGQFYRTRDTLVPLALRIRHVHSTTRQQETSPSSTFCNEPTPAQLRTAARLIKGYFFRAAEAYEGIERDEDFAKSVISVWGIVLLFQVVQYLEFLESSREEYWWRVLRNALQSPSCKNRLENLGVEVTKLAAYGSEPTYWDEP